MIYLATGNRHKVEEMGLLLGAEVMGAEKLGGMPEVIEDAETFYGNALKKGMALVGKLEEEGDWVLADDSGICVDELGGGPGVYSARYAGVGASSEGNNLKLLEAMEGKESRGARFVCVLVLMNRRGQERVYTGIVRGRIAEGCRGGEGFGYDPLFIPEGEERTYGELGWEYKGRMSHRALAVRGIREYLGI